MKISAILQFDQTLKGGHLFSSQASGGHARRRGGRGEFSGNHENLYRSMYGIFTYMFLMFLVNVGKYIYNFEDPTRFVMNLLDHNHIFQRL